MNADKHGFLGDDPRASLEATVDTCAKKKKRTDETGRVAAVTMHVAITVLNVLTNLGYVVPSYMLAVRRLYAEATIVGSVVLWSTVFHLCQDGDLCIPGVPTLAWKLLDHLFANLALGQIVLLAITYKLVERRRVYYEDSSKRSRISGHALVGVRGAPAMRAAYLIGTVAIVVVFLDGVGEYVGTLALAAFSLAVAYAVSACRRKKGRGIIVLTWSSYWSRVRLMALLLAAISIAISAALFFAEDAVQEAGSSVRFLHALWHTNGALTAVFLIVAFADHFRATRLSNIIGVEHKTRRDR